MNRACIAVASTFAFALGFGSGDVIALPLTGDFAVTTDDTGGLALDADFSASPSENFTLNVGAGHSGGSTETADLSGTMFNAGASLHGERAGVAIGYDLFDDSANYHAATLAARAWVRAGDFEFALLGRQRDMKVNLLLDLPLRSVRREVDFSATGGGLQVAFTRGSVNAYIMTIEYEYDDEFTDFLDLAGSPLLERRPRVEALLGSFLTQAQGTIDRQTGIGIERTFGQNSLTLDFSSVHDAVLDASSTSMGLTYRRAQTAHVDWAVSAGMVDSEAYGGVGFVGVSLGLAN